MGPGKSLDQGKNYWIIKKLLLRPGLVLQNLESELCGSKTLQK